MIAESAVIAAGIFLFWVGLFYGMSGIKERLKMTMVFTVLFYAALIQTFAYSKGLGNMSNIMVYDFETTYSATAMCVNILVIALLVFAVLTVRRKIPRLFNNISIILVTALFVLSAANLVKAERIISENSYIKDDRAYEENAPTYTLSRNGRNVIVLMLDRAMSGYFPYIVSEFPELKEEFSGFTYYPNTYSYGAVTLTGGPALFAGYDYLPQDIAKDPDKIQARLDSSIRFLPYNFSKAGFNSTVFDPPDYIDLSGRDLDTFLDGIDNMRAYEVGGLYKTPEGYAEDYEYLHKWARHNYIRHSFYITAPCALRSLIYDDGNYLSTDRIKDDMTLEGELQSLDFLPRMTDISDADDDNLFVYTNLAAHSYAELQLPDFTLSDNVDNTGLIDAWSRSLHADNAMPIDDMTEKDRFIGYCANVAALKALGGWMEYLKSEGVYDNTRIIIAADHGFDAFAFPQMIYEGGTSFEQFNPLLLVKDFGSSDFSTDEEFMSNADVCAIAMNGIIDDPVDPYDGKDAVLSIDKTAQNETLSDAREYADLDSRLYEVHDDVRDPANWTVLFAE